MNPQGMKRYIADGKSVCNSTHSVSYAIRNIKLV